MSENWTPEKRTGDWVPVFLAMLRESGNVRLSCSQAGIARSLAYARRESDPEFRRQWDEALEEALDLLEAAARARALTISDTLLIFLLKSHRRHIYGDKVDVTLTVRQEAERIAAEQGLDADEIMAEAMKIIGGAG